MWTRMAQVAGRLGLLLLIVTLAACGTSQAAAPASATPGEPGTATPAVPTIAASAATSTMPPTLAAPTGVPTLTPPTATEPTLTSQPAGPTATATQDPAVTAVLAYLEARARADVAAVTNLSCKAWKPKAVTEAVSFRSMNAKLVGVTCHVSGSASSFTLVGCGGKMVTTYGTETRDWDLSTFVYQVTAEDGQWKMCGYH